MLGNPDQQIGHSVNTTGNTEATQLIQILSYTKSIIKINFPVRQHQPTHRHRRKEGRDKWARQQRS